MEFTFDIYSSISAHCWLIAIQVKANLISTSLSKYFPSKWKCSKRESKVLIFFVAWKCLEQTQMFSCFRNLAALHNAEIYLKWCNTADFVDIDIFFNRLSINLFALTNPTFSVLTLSSLSVSIRKTKFNLTIGRNQ